MKYIPYVNIKMGTKSSPRFSKGNTLPLVQLPFGMASFCVQSERVSGRERWFFNPDLPSVEGIRLTHQPSPWIGDYGTFLMTPQNDVISNTADGAWSGYRIEEAVFRPDYLKIRFLRQNCIFELTPTERGGAIRLEFENEEGNYLSFLPIEGNYTYKFDERNNTLFGTSDHHSQDIARDFKMYFAVKFSKGSVDSIKSYKGRDYAHIALNGRTIEAKIGISYISYEMAYDAAENEDFDELKDKAESNWEEKLSRIEVEDSEEKMKTFYSCMYRAFLFPHKSYEVKKDGTRVHYSPFDGEIREGVRYTDTGFWDTSRTQFPLFSLIAKDEYAEMLEGFVNDYLECGYLPRWTSIGEVGCMPSTLIDGVIAEASAHDIIPKELLEKALNGMLHHANNESKEKRFGRNGAEKYAKLGYVPCDLYKESVNLTLDSAYGDWCIAMVAKKLGKSDIEKEYLKRAKNYESLFCKESGFMRGRMENGEFREAFDPLGWGGDYTESSAYQASLFVPHDIEGLCQLHGGKNQLLSTLDKLFSTPPKYKVHGYGGEIHEMTEMAQVDFYQFAISNQPSFHLPYIYGALGEKEKNTYWVHKALSELFSSDSGFPGDEDNGSMASWYILSALGKYPICPGKKEYVEIPQFFKKIKIK